MSVTRLSRLAAAVVFVAGGMGLLGGAGCGVIPEPDPVPAEETTVVLTFDDGPMAADVGVAERSAAGSAVSDPLRGILDVLERREIRGVFYVAGPGCEGTDDVWAGGVAAMHEADHVVGYHAFDHSAAFWTDPFQTRDVAWDLMQQDYLQLQAFVDKALAPIGLAQAESFSPLFRLPYGGGVTGWLDGPVVGERLGWTCHGYALDSLDWTVNADVDPGVRDALQALAENDPELLVLERLHTAGTALASRPVVDVLFHVNALTAAHLDEWIETLTAALSDAGVDRVVVGVPEEYLSESDPTSDLTALVLMLLGA